jgi:hypothetical protein
MLKNNYQYIENWKTKLLVLLIVFLINSFIILFLEPFKTEESNKFTVLGYSCCILIAYLVVLFVEAFIFKRKRTWLLQDEIGVFVLLFIFSSISVYWYDLVIIKDQIFYWGHFLPFTFKITLPFGILLIPLMLGLRYYFGMLYELPNQYQVAIIGNTKADILEIDWRQIFYIKSANNYIEVKYASLEGEIKNKLMRCTLSKVADQLPDFLQCHRSYLLHPDKIVGIKGSQKKAVLLVKNLEEEIPLSKSYYNNIKSKLKL